MQVNLSAHELDLLDKALVAYQNEPESRGAMSALITGLSMRDSSMEKRLAHMDAERNKLAETIR